MILCGSLNIASIATDAPSIVPALDPVDGIQHPIGNGYTHLEDHQTLWSLVERILNCTEKVSSS
ncbi:hypothetical protein RSSM_01046 [Rhodopirellula sallentina SM41]|uniref:Uncharacterized protein n=1 Tax=Rhodopirellula sallentina SM41 TaxID=1263870 RepID=M5U7Q5_9BACT|nr:hypothetical protein RSSM_01046 [Rhodopirellula sallentina SM41]